MEELNKYLSRLSEHHDMYVLSRVLVANIGFTDTYLGLKLDRVKRSSFLQFSVYDTSPMQCYRSGIFIDPSRPAKKRNA